MGASENGSLKPGFPKGMIHGGSTAELQVLLSRDPSNGHLGHSGRGPGNSNLQPQQQEQESKKQVPEHQQQRPKSPLHSLRGTCNGSPASHMAPEGASPPGPAFTPAMSSLSIASSYNPHPSSASLPSSAFVVAMFSAVLYGTVGLAMGFINKAVLMQWPFSNSLLMFQMAASVAMIYLASLLRLVETRPLTVRGAMSLWGVVFFYNANVGFALAAVQALSIPMYHVLKRLTPVMILLAKLVMGEPPPPIQITLSVCTVVAGCFLSGAGDLSFDIRGYACAIFSCALQSAYLISVERSGSDKGFTSSELMVYNAVLSLPVLMLLTVATGEAFHSIPALLELSLDPSSSAFFWLFVISLCAGVLLNYSLFLCTLCNTALTTTIVGSLRSVLGTVLGFFLLGGVKATVLIIAGCTINTMGAVWYTVAKMRQKLLKTTGSSKDQQVQEYGRGQGEEAMPLKSSQGA